MAFLWAIVGAGVSVLFGNLADDILEEHHTGLLVGSIGCPDDPGVLLTGSTLINGIIYPDNECEVQFTSGPLSGGVGDTSPTGYYGFADVAPGQKIWFQIIAGADLWHQHDGDQTVAHVTYNSLVVEPEERIPYVVREWWDTVGADEPIMTLDAAPGVDEVLAP